MIVHFVTTHVPMCLVEMLYHVDDQFRFISAWQGTAGQEDSKRQVATGAKLYGILKL